MYLENFGIGLYGILFSLLNNFIIYFVTLYLLMFNCPFDLFSFTFMKVIVLNISTISPLFMERFTRSLRVPYLKFDKTAIYDSFVAHFCVFQEGVEFYSVLSPLFVDRFGGSLRFCHLRFYKEAIYDSFMAHSCVFFQGGGG